VCTLEQVAPHLLGCINDDNFAVAYTLVSYTGVSMIDYRFRLNHDVNQNDARDIILRAINDGKLKELFAVVLLDNGLEEYKFTRYSAVFVKPSIKIKGRNLYISAYFDNEN
jgi:glyceraldehyde 3-phosphate dehydrogenase